MLTFLFFIMAFLYSTVGHAGASGYLASMALLGVAPPIMKPTALVLNILVAGITTFNFWRAGHLRWNLLWPFAVCSIPTAFLGGAITLPAALYRPLLGVVLLYSSYRMLRVADVGPAVLLPYSRGAAFLIGGMIGFFSGLTGVGGGIFLSPLIILLGWADTKKTAAVSAAFILVNSIAGLSGNLAALHRIPDGIAIWGAAVVCGGTIGSTLGSRRFENARLRKILSVVLVIAGMKLLLV